MDRNTYRNLMESFDKIRKDDEPQDLHEALPSGVKINKIKSLIGGAVEYQVTVNNVAVGSFYTGKDHNGTFYTTRVDMNGRATYDRGGQAVRNRDQMIDGVIKSHQANAAHELAMKKSSPNRVEMKGDKVTGVFHNGKKITDHGIKIDTLDDIRRRGALFDLEDKYNVEFSVVRESTEITEAPATAGTNANVKVGDWFVSTWGYDQTNASFYKVTKLIGKDSVELQEYQTEQIKKGDYYSMQGVGVPSSKATGSPIRKKIQMSKYETPPRPVIKINSYSNARPWNGKPVYISWDA